MKYRVNGAKVSLVEDEILVAGAIGLHYAEFELDPSWDEYTTIIAVFKNKNEGEEREQIIEDGKCEIPWEVLANSGTLHVGIYATTENKIRPTLWAIGKTINEGAGACEASQEPTPDKWQQLLYELARIEGADPELIEALVRAYLKENPPSVVENDPTVPEWAKQPTKPTYTAEEIGAISVDELQNAINDALLQAKESGEFNGADGKDGKDGKDGANGVDGYTPQKGIDYYTDADKAEMVDAVLAALPNGDEVSY